jgi:hypothetical protein
MLYALKEGIIFISDETLQASGYEKWSANEPHTRPGDSKECGLFIGNKSNVGFADAGCKMLYNFICEH